MCLESPHRSLFLLPTNPNGVVVYEGKSQLDGSPIVAILTGLKRKSANSKTGALAQLFILDATHAPHDAQRTGDDASVCGACPFRPYDQTTDKRCYVKTWQGPLAVWKAWKGGRYGNTSLQNGAHALLTSPDEGVRFGAYGDPAALPSWVLEALSTACTTAGKRWTGYTHQWRDTRHVWTSRYLMASCESSADVTAARALGFRAFTAYPTAANPAELEGILCPNLSHGVSCSKCRLCDGSTGPNDKRADIYLPQHT